MEPYETYGSKGHHILEPTEKLGYIRVGTICVTSVNGFANIGMLTSAGFTYECAGGSLGGIHYHGAWGWYPTRHS